MRHKKVSKLKKGNKFKVPVFTDKGVYISWVKLLEIKKIPLYNPALLPNNFSVFVLVDYEVLSGRSKGRAIQACLKDEWDVIIPDLPGRWARIWKLLFTSSSKLQVSDDLDNDK